MRGGYPLALPYPFATIGQGRPILACGTGAVYGGQRTGYSPISCAVPTCFKITLAALGIERLASDGVPCVEVDLASVFISYSHQDEDLRRQLIIHLKPFVDAGVVNIWYDGHIPYGGVIEKEIAKNLRDSNIILLLVSSDFLASRSCQAEVDVAMTLRNNGVAVIPVILRACNWRETALGQLRAAPQDGIPVVVAANIDAALTQVAQAVGQVAVRINEQAATPVPATPVPATPEVADLIQNFTDETFINRYNNWNFANKNKFNRIVSALHAAGLDMWYVNMHGELRIGFRAVGAANGSPLAFIRPGLDGPTFRWNIGRQGYQAFVGQYPHAHGYGQPVDEAFVTALENLVRNGMPLPAAMDGRRGHFPPDYLPDA